MDELIDWLQGYELPPVGHEDEPFMWILRGLPEADERYWAESQLAIRVAQFLVEKPDQERPGDHPDQVLYNLLMLCAGLSCPDQLADLLYQLFERRQLSGQWRGVDLRDALTAALISNQIDNRLEEVWRQMSQGLEHDYLTGDEFDGFEGTRLMPPSQEKRGVPSLDAIGTCLKAIASGLNDETDRRKEFRYYLKRVIETYPGWPTWEVDLILQADRNHWPTWAIESLPKLYVAIDRETYGRESKLIWHYVLACIPESYSYEVLQELCDGQVLEVIIPESHLTFFELIAQRFEQARHQNPFPSDRSIIGVITAALCELELLAQTSNDAHLAGIIEEARRKILGRAGLLPDFVAIGEAIERIVVQFPSEHDREARVRVLVRAARGVFSGVNLKQKAEESGWSREVLLRFQKAA
jgi:hypothetical protein